MKLFKAIAIVAALWCATEANAAIGLRLGEPQARGTGCPTPDSVATVLSPGEDAVSVLFSEFQTEAGRQIGLPMTSRKACSLAIPVVVPQGYQVSVIQTDYRGFNLVPAGGRNMINTEYFWAGIRGPRYSKTFLGPVVDSFTTSNAVLVSSQVWSACGAQVILRVNTDIMSISNRQGEQSMMTVDSADISSALIYSLQWRRCR
jgi:hypothetical protein